MLGKCIENVEIDLDNEKKCKMNSNRNYLENILGIVEDAENQRYRCAQRNERIHTCREMAALFPCLDIKLPATV